MDKLGRLVLVGIVAGLLTSIWATVSHLVLQPFAVSATSLFKQRGFAQVVIGFGLSLGQGFLYVAAYALMNGGKKSGRWKKLLSFWGILMLVSVAPRGLAVYNTFAAPDRYVVAAAVAWVVEALLVALVVTFLWPRVKTAAEVGRA